MVGACIGDHSRRSANKLWLSLLFQESGNTNYVERVDNIFRQKIGRSVWKISEEDIIFFQKIEKPYWRYLEFYSLLQRFFACLLILSFLGLP